MNNIYIYFFLLFSLIGGNAAINAEGSSGQTTQLWSPEFQNELMIKVGLALPKLVTYPIYQYPNAQHKSAIGHFKEGKVLVFGYGSLMNKASLARSVSREAVKSMTPAIAFGVKRLFNYKAKNTAHWGADQDPKEKAMLNVAQTFDISSMANGVYVEVDSEDLSKLVNRETGYDLVPIIIAKWNDVIAQNTELEMVVAYTFVATRELRNHIDYTSTEYYPVRGYMHAVQEAALTFGEAFAELWNATTYMADGTTSINDWDEVTFKGILCTFTD
jgi:cation transport regulator ChaC